MVEKFVEEARQFVDTEFLMSLYQRSSLQGEERQRIKDKLCYYTGVTDEFLETHTMRFDEWSYRTEFARN